MSERRIRRVVVILPDNLLQAADEAAKKLYISRLAFIRQSIARNLKESLGAVEG